MGFPKETQIEGQNCAESLNGFTFSVHPGMFLVWTPFFLFYHQYYPYYSTFNMQYGNNDMEDLIMIVESTNDSIIVKKSSVSIACTSPQKSIPMFK